MTELGLLQRIFGEMPAIVVAVSGGVDSLTLGLLAHRFYRQRTEIVHAISAAVPAEATGRVESMAISEGWRLTLVNAGEFSDPDYLRNPLDRCYYCKSNLFRAIRRVSTAQILTGANTDDLLEYRPGLIAAADFGVRHPYVEAKMPKESVRRLASDLGFESISDLPASPCLASRIETGIPIEEEVLQAVYTAEHFVLRQIQAKTVRVRLRSGGLAVELDTETLALVDDCLRDRLTRLILPLFKGRATTLDFASYRAGSSFLVPNHEQS